MADEFEQAQIVEAAFISGSNESEPGAAHSFPETTEQPQTSQFGTIDAALIADDNESTHQHTTGNSAPGLSVQQPPRHVHYRIRLPSRADEYNTFTTATGHSALPSIGGPHRISFPYSGDQVPINMGSGNVVTIPLQRNPAVIDGMTTVPPNNGSVNVRVLQRAARVDPLIPQPVADAETSIQGGAHQQRPEAENPDLQRFKCDICYDFLRVNPVGCGKCSARFCIGCLLRVRYDEARRQQEHKCPFCRVEYEESVPDDNLRQEMETGPTIPCRHEGCPVNNLQIARIVSHEQVCEHVLVHCRFAMFGCRWTGKRREVSEHEQNSCRICPMGPFVEQFRQFRADQLGRVDMAIQQAAGVARTQAVIRQSISQHSMKSTTDVFELLHFFQCLTCSFPVTFFARDQWFSYWSSEESRASVVNFLVFLPLAIPCLTIGSQSLSSFCLCIDKFWVAGSRLMNEGTISTLTLEKALSAVLTPQLEQAMENASIGLFVAMLGALAVSLNFLDEKSSKSWKGIRVGQLGTPPIVGDGLGVAVFGLFMCILVFYDAGARASSLWFLVLFASTFFPAVALALSHVLARKEPPTVSNIASLARSIEPVMFGLRYSFLEAYFGLSACLDAALIIGLAPRSVQNKCLKDCFVGQIPEIVCMAFLGFKVAMWVLEARQQLSQELALKDFFASVADSLLAAFALRLMNALVHAWFHFGIKLGSVIASQSHRCVRPEGTIKDYSTIGILVFGMWFGTLVCIMNA